MAKIAKKKQQTAPANPRSRAAKRATSPSINVDKSIKETPRVLGTSPILGVSHNSGVSKKRKTKQMTRGQRARQEKGLARAEVVMDQLEKKVDGAKTKLKTRNIRKALWEDVNESTMDEQRKAMKGPGRAVTTEDEPNDDQPQDAGDVDMSSTKQPNPTDEPPTSLREQLLAASFGEPAPVATQSDEVDLIT